MTESKPLLDVLNNRVPQRRPIWLMRQAGRYLPEYRAVREKAGSFLKLCYDPMLAAEVTLQPLRRFDFDAAILFSDILVVPHAMGLSLDFVENEGPLLSTVRSAADVAGLKTRGPFTQFDLVCQTVANVKKGLEPRKTLIGFCGAPWTVASYMIEGRGSDRALALATARERPQWFDDLMQKLVEVSTAYLLMQIAAGAETVQIFDSWAGDLPEDLRAALVYQPIAQMVRAIRAVHPGFPVIVFARGIGGAHAQAAVATSASCVSVEQDTDIGAAVRSLPAGVAVQGNLDPDLVLAGGDALRSAIAALLTAVPMQRHVFNLGHGIKPQTDPQTVSMLVAMVREHDQALSR
jgi:uroporphyrinogen decarboxylase